MGEINTTSLKEASEELKQDIAEFVEDSSLAFTIVDSEGKLIYFNKGAEALTGWKRAEAIGKTLEFLYPQQEELDRLLKILNEKGKFEDESTYILTKTGEKIPLSLSVSKIGDRGSLGVSINRSDQDILFGGLEKKNEEVEFLLDLLAHDITNINCLIMENLEILQNKITDPNQKKTLNSTIAQLKRGTKLVQNIQNLVKNHQRADNAEEINLNLTIKKLLEEIQPAFPQVVIDSKSNIARGTTLNIDPLFNDLLYNIIINSIQNRKDSDHVSLLFSLDSNQDTVNINVDHKGKPILVANGDKPVISVSVAKRIIERFGGTISFRMMKKETEMENRITLHLPKSFLSKKDK
ncbi:MAG: PAS domain S-box protein [Candidatus Hermodarchaeota archaeon]